MKVSELKRGMSGVSVEGKVKEKSEARRVRTRYGPRSVADVELADETGTIRVSLWEDDIDRVNVGDEIRIEGAFVTEFRNELQLNVPRSGSIKVLKENVLEL